MSFRTKVFEKGTTINIFEVVDKYGQQLLNFELTLGNNILKSDKCYINYNGSLIVSEEEVENAIREYMSNYYPMVYDYMVDINDCLYI